MGDTLWTRTYSGHLGEGAIGSAVDVDSDGFIYITGQSLGSPSGVLTVKYSPTGDTVWVRTDSGPQGAAVVGTDIVVDDSGNVYVTANEGGLHPDNSETIKYDPDGSVHWVRRWVEDPHIGTAAGLVLDGEGNPVVTGYVDNSNIVTIKYSPEGDTLWHNSYDGPGFDSTNYNEPYDIQVDDSNNVFIVGDSRDVTGVNDIVVLKYTAEGDAAWVRTYGPDENVNYEGRAVAVDKDGSVYVCGSTRYSESENDDIVILKYDRHGRFRWMSAGWMGEGNRGRDIVVNDQYDVFVTGRAEISTSAEQWLTLKFSQEFCCEGFRGNLDNDPGDNVDISDLVYLVDHMFTGGPEPTCVDEADINDSGELDISDLVHLVDYMFTGGPAPVACPH